MAARTIRTFADLASLSQAAAEEFLRTARAAVAAHGRFRVALSGGSTPKRLFQLLAAEPSRGQVDWSRTDIFWGDERCVPPDHPDSNYRMACEALLDHVSIPAEQVHRIHAERPNKDAVAREYEQTIAQVFGVQADGPPPAFDLVLLGMGPDGHTASLFPHTAALNEQKRWVVANYVPKFKADRITLTRPILNQARAVLFLVAGADKAEPLAEVLNGPADPTRLPSQSIEPSAGRLVWFVDSAAAARLTQPDRASSGG
jgi:6-phosphogluconolactonase